MICPNCRKQLPDSAESCSYCGTHINHKEQVKHEIKFRRYQRWILFAVIGLLFAGAIGVSARIYTANTELIEKMTATQTELDKVRKEIEEKNSELGKIKENLAGKEDDLKKYLTQIQEKNAELASKTDEFKQVLDEKTSEVENYKQQLDLADSNIYNLIIRLGSGVTNDDLARIPIADANMAGEDDDGDGLSNLLESAIGTDSAKADTDGDGYDDKSEILGGYNPNGLGALPIDNNFANSQKGRILLQVEGNGEAWYVSPGDGKRYFLGRPADAFRIMRDTEYWNSRNQ